jgi:hypothetical protein
MASVGIALALELAFLRAHRHELRRSARDNGRAP